MKSVVLTRITIETISPLSIYSGERTLLSNDALARDWNGLPYIPATSLTGVWKSVLDEKFSEELDFWFGSLSEKMDDDKRKASRMLVSDALMLNHVSELPGNAQKLRGVITAEDIRKDSLLSRFTLENDKDFERTNCSISSRKSAKNKALFKTLILPKGLRFAFDVKAELDEDKDFEKYEQLLGYIGSVGFSIGARTSNGHGQFKVIGIKTEQYRIGDYAEHPEELAGNIRRFMSSRKVPLDTKDSGSLLSDSGSFIIPEGWEFSLESKGTWRLGNGRKSAEELSEGRNRTIKYLESERKSEQTPQKCFSDGVVEWNPDNTFRQIKYELLVPGSTVKGIIAHRTLFHYLRINECFADEASPLDVGSMVSDLHNGKKANALLDDYCEIFGANDPENPDGVKSGAVRISDCRVDCSGAVTRTHNRLDRFTGGVMPSSLFSQEKIVNPRIYVSIRIRRDRWEKLKEKPIGEALNRTIYDLKNGFLNICAGAGRDTAVFSEYKEGNE